jgi:chromatin structure-remodeling complex subunit RSC4
MTGDTKGGAEGHDDDPQQDDGHESGLKDGADDDTKRKKVMNRLLTARLDKLVAKKGDACVPVLFLPLLFSLYPCRGNILSNDFMELPSKKIWAIYYKTISRPMSFEKIYVRHIPKLFDRSDAPPS